MQSSVSPRDKLKMLLLRMIERSDNSVAGIAIFE